MGQVSAGAIAAGWVVWLAAGCGAVLLEDRCTLMTSEVVTFRFAVETMPEDSNAIAVIDGMHVDMETGYVCGGGWCRWEFGLAGSGWHYGPEEAWLYVGPAARYNLASIPDRFGFIGARANEVFWILPQSAAAAPGALYAGFSSERMGAWEKGQLCSWNPEEARGGANAWAKWLRVRLADVRRPAGGEFSMWQADQFGNVAVHFSTYEGGVGPEDVYHYTAGGHTHMNWGFTKAGVYEVDLEVSTYYRCSAGLTGDLNGDCVVDFGDVGVMAMQWGDACGDPNSCSADKAWPAGVGLEDLAILAEQWLACGSPFDPECVK